MGPPPVEIAALDAALRRSQFTQAAWGSKETASASAPASTSENIDVQSSTKTTPDEECREFSATAVVRGSQGTRRMPVTFIANRFTSVEQAKQLAEVLEQGGQQALLSALTGRRDGQLRLGALEMPIALVVAEPQGKGYRYLFLTPRRIQVEETTFGEESPCRDRGLRRGGRQFRGSPEGEVAGSGHHNEQRRRVVLAREASWQPQITQMARSNDAMFSSSARPPPRVS